MIENLIYTVLFAILVIYAVVLSFDVCEARKNKNKFDFFLNSVFLFAVLFFIINFPLFSWSVYNFI